MRGGRQRPGQRNDHRNEARGRPGRPPSAPRKAKANAKANAKAKAERPRKRVAIRRANPLRRLRIGLLALAVVCSLFAGRLIQLQGIESAGYAQRAEAQRLIKLDLPATRGAITDASGKQLAMTVDARSVYADPELIDQARKPRVAARVAALLDLDRGEVRRKLDAPNDRFVVLEHGVTPTTARKVLDLDFTGIATLPEYRRVYPGGSIAPNVTGFVGDEDKGLAGIEYGANDVLAGRDGWQRVEISPDGQHIPMGDHQKREPVPGKDVRLTLDRDIQWKAQQAIAAQVDKTKADSGSIIAMDPRTGRILSMATAPGFDPSEPERADPDDLGNRALGQVFEPGSTNKVITAAAAMEEAGIRPDSTFTVPSRISRGGTTFTDSHPHPTRRLTFEGVLVTSSNVGTIMAADRLTPQQLHHYLRAFGFGQPTGVDFPGETPGLLPPVNEWSGSQRYTVAFGQGVSVNALQMASVYATIANGGVRVTPSLVAGTANDDGKFTPADAPKKRRVISAEVAGQLSRMLEGVTSDEGTAARASIPGYRVAGKTGTAERVDPDCGCYRGYTSTFVGYAPADEPRLMVQVVLQNPKKGHYGGAVAAPVFSDVMSFALKSRKIPPTGTESPRTRLYADR